MSELKPCPHCEGKTSVVNFMPGKPDGYWQGVCRKCGMRTRYHQTRRDAIAAMNRRAQPDHIGDATAMVAQPDNELLVCEGCVDKGQHENEVEYGYPSPCTRCKRRSPDNYRRKPEPEGGDR